MSKSPQSPPRWNVPELRNSEFVLSAGLDWEIGGSGSSERRRQVFDLHAEIKFGKGFGDLPDDMALSAAPSRSRRRSAMRFPAQAANPNRSQWAGALEYSLLYLQNNVRDQGFSTFVAHLTPIVEFSFSSPVDAGGATTGTINPGLIWSGQREQVAVEAILPVNHASGDNIGVIAQLHFYIDDLFPNTLGTPIFGGTR